MYTIINRRTLNSRFIAIQYRKCRGKAIRPICLYVCLQVAQCLLFVNEKECGETIRTANKQQFLLISYLCGIRRPVCLVQ